MKSRIGYLWDSLSANTGDQAIGLTLLRHARRAGLEALAPVRIGEPLAGAYDLLVIGGGELLHPAGHPYYDLFRVPGEHVLNTVGTLGAVEASYLSSYRLVSVRSEADRRHLEGVEREVRVVPCLSVLFDEVAEGGTPIDVPGGAIGLHLQPASFGPGTAGALGPLLRRIDAPLALLPFTRYNLDERVQSAFARAADLPPPLPIQGPDQAFDTIRRLRGLVTTSLHATIFAYIAGVPFLAVPYAAKVEHFLRERGLSHRLLPDLTGLPDKLALLEPGSADWGEALAADREAARALAGAIFAVCEEALSHPPGAGRGRLDAWREPTHPVQAHAVMIERHAEYGKRIADTILFDHEISRARAHIAGLDEQIEAANRQRREVEAYVGNLLAELERAQAELGRADRCAADLESRVAELDGRVAELDRRAALLRAELSRYRRPRIHAVTVHHQGRELLKHSLRGLLASEGVELRIVVVSNACREPLPDEAETEPAIHVVRSEVSLGFSAANNLGVTWAREHLGDPDHWLFINNDALVGPDTLYDLSQGLEAAPRAGIAGPLLVIWGAEDHLNSLGLNVTTLGEAWDEGIGVPLREYGPLPGRREMLAVTGSALLIRDAALRDVGGWSEIYGYYYEDIDLCLKARSRGWTVVHVPEAVASHAISATADQITDFKRLLSWRNQFVLMLCHWPLPVLLRVLPRLLGGQLKVFVQRLRIRCYADARLQARSWAGALRLLPQALAQRRRGTDGTWTRLLRPAGSVPVIRLPVIPPGRRPWEQPSERGVEAANVLERSPS